MLTYASFFKLTANFKQHTSCARTWSVMGTVLSTAKIISWSNSFRRIISPPTDYLHPMILHHNCFTLRPMNTNLLFTYGGLKQVVMAFVDGVTAHGAYGSASTLLNVLFGKVEQVVTVLHENGLVFGDLRPSNIMVSEKAFLIDFDWCAKDGAGRYLVRLNNVGHRVAVQCTKNMTFSWWRDCTLLETYWRYGWLSIHFYYLWCPPYYKLYLMKSASLFFITIHL